MPGEEIAAAKAAQAVVKGIGKVAGEDDTTKAQLSRLAEDAPEMKNAARLHARRAEVRQMVRLKLWEPVGRLFGINKEYFDTSFIDDLADKLADVPEEEIQTPALNVAGPAIEGLSFNLDEPDLKEMFLNLIATASDARYSDDAHPSFPRVVGELTGKEANFLNGLLKLEQTAIVNVRVVADEGGYFVVFRNVVDAEPSDGEGPEVLAHISAWIDNWVRLGLFQINWMSSFTDPSWYDFVQTRPEVVSLRAEGRGVDVEKGILSVTDRGRLFARAVGATEHVPKLEPHPDDPITPTPGTLG